MEKRPNILKLASKISLESMTYTGITYNDPEYKILAPIVDDDMCAVMMRMRLESDITAEQLAAAGERFAAPEAQLRFHAGGEPGEGQHLAVKAQGVAADAQQLRLRLVAVLLRDEQHAAALACDHAGADGVHDGGGFAAFRSAEIEMQHREISFRNSIDVASIYSFVTVLVTLTNILSL